MVQSLVHSERIHFPPHTFSGFQGSLQEMPGNLYGEKIGDSFPGAPLVFVPCGQRQRDPDRPAIHEELNIHRIGMASGNGNDQRLIQAVNLLLGPAVEGVEIAIHEFKTISIRMKWRQTRSSAKPGKFRARGHPPKEATCSLWGLTMNSAEIRFRRDTARDGEPCHKLESVPCLGAEETRPRPE